MLVISRPVSVPSSYHSETVISPCFCNFSVSSLLNSFFLLFSSVPLPVTAVCAPVVVFRHFLVSLFFIQVFLVLTVCTMYTSHQSRCYWHHGWEAPWQRIASFRRRNALTVPSQNLDGQQFLLCYLLKNLFHISISMRQYQASHFSFTQRLVHQISCCSSHCKHFCPVLINSVNGWSLVRTVVERNFSCQEELFFLYCSLDKLFLVASPISMSSTFCKFLTHFMNKRVNTTKNSTKHRKNRTIKIQDSSKNTKIYRIYRTGGIIHHGS